MQKKRWLKCPYKKEAGVYKITNEITKDFYIGASGDIKMRYYSHWDRMKKGNHDNGKIKEDAKLYTRNSFVFEVLEYCDRNKLLEREEHYFNLLKPTYNAWKSVHSAKDRSFTPEQLISFKINHNPIKDKKKHSDSLKKAWAKRRFEPETIAQLARINRSGIKHTTETLKLMSEQRKGKPKSAAWCEKTKKRRLGTKWDPINKIWIKKEENEVRSVL